MILLRRFYDHYIEYLGDIQTNDIAWCHLFFFSRKSRVIIDNGIMFYAENRDRVVPVGGVG